MQHGIVRTRQFGQEVTLEGISSQCPPEAARQEEAPHLDVPQAVCSEPQVRHPIRCGVPATRANSTPSFTSAVL